MRRRRRRPFFPKLGQRIPRPFRPDATSSSSSFSFSIGESSSTDEITSLATAPFSSLELTSPWTRSPWQRTRVSDSLKSSSVIWHLIFQSVEECPELIVDKSRPSSFSIRTARKKRAPFLRVLLSIFYLCRPFNSIWPFKYAKVIFRYFLSHHRLVVCRNVYRKKLDSGIQIPPIRKRNCVRYA